MLERLRKLINQYPGQFWMMFVGMLIMTIGSSMIWPFLMVYVSGKLNLPLTTVASLMTINAVMTLISSFISGPIIDKVGRKWAMVVSLLLSAVVYIFMSQADTLLGFAILMGLQGAINPLYRVGADAMMADLISPEKRVEAYSLLRMSNNVGVAIGPAIGGFIATSSYTFAFFCAAAGMAVYGFLTLFLAKETLPGKADGYVPVAEPVKERFGGYGRVVRDWKYVFFIFSLTLNGVGVAMIWVLLAVYAKTNFQIPENLYGFIPTTNAIMVVAFQLLVTRFTRKFPALPVIMVGAAFYTVATFSIAFGTSFWGFWLSMVVMTIGELILVPTATTYVANLAPADMRGRYMSLYGLTWGVAAGIGPLYGGFLNDTFSPRAIWIGGGLVGLVSLVALFVLNRVSKPRLLQPVEQVMEA